MISLSSRESRPIPAQVAESLRRLVSAGAFLPGEALPAPQELACALAVSPVAVFGAYRSLEEEGVLTAHNDTFQVAETAGSQRKQALLNTWDETTDELLVLGVTRQELEKRLKEVAK